jgi:peptidoglycan/xylan/chitin deacetylase (PgdA/CDA1 family)
MKSIILKIADDFHLPKLALSVLRTPRIVLYHGVTERHSFPGIENYREKIVPVKVFLKQIEFLQSNFRIVSLKDLIDTWSGSPQRAKSMIAITFDDGYQNNFRVVFPILKEKNIPFTIFLPTDFIENKIPLWVDRLEYAIGNADVNKLNIRKGEKEITFSLESRTAKIQADSFIRNLAKTISNKQRSSLINEVVRQCGQDLINHLLDQPDYKPLTWNEVLLMANSGLVEIGSHAVSHAIATSLPLEDFRKEIIVSKKIIESKTRKKCLFFAYPNGQPNDFSAPTNQVIKEVGFFGALTTVMGFLNSGEDRFSLPRLDMGETHNEKVFFSTLSGVRMFFRKTRDYLKIKT